MRKIVLIHLFVAVAYIFAYTESHRELCKKVDQVAHEAETIYKKFKDPENALLLMKHSVFSRVLYQKPKCMENKSYIKYINLYAKYLSETTNYVRPTSFFDNFIKRYPKNAPMYLYLGNIYRKMFTRSDYRKFEYKDKALTLYGTYIELSKKQGFEADKEIRDYIANEGLEKAKNTWGNYLNPDGIIIDNRFIAFYLNMQNPKKVVATEVTDAISVNYSWKEFHNIDAQHFGAYWIGSLVFDKDRKMQIALSLSWAKVRVIIDGLLVYEGRGSAEIPFLFKRGKHKVEVEYINNWHTVNFTMHILPFHKQYDQNALKKELSRFGDGYDVWYVGMHESGNVRNRTMLSVQKSKRSVVLFLQSYRPVVWNIQNKYDTKIDAIVVGKSKPGSEVLGITHDIPIYYADFWLANTNELYPNHCNCTSGTFHCEGSGIESVNNTLVSLTGKKANGFSGKYKAKLLKVPEVILDDTKYTEIKKKLKEIEEKRKACLKNNNPNFDKIFQ